MIDWEQWDKKKDIPIFSGLNNIEVYSKSWRSNTQPSECSQQYCTINFKAAEKLNLNCSYYKNEMTIV